MVLHEILRQHEALKLIQTYFETIITYFFIFLPQIDKVNVSYEIAYQNS